MQLACQRTGFICASMWAVRAMLLLHGQGLELRHAHAHGFLPCTTPGIPMAPDETLEKLPDPLVNDDIGVPEVFPILQTIMGGAATAG